MSFKKPHLVFQHLFSYFVILLKFKIKLEDGFNYFSNGLCDCSKFSVYENDFQSN